MFTKDAPRPLRADGDARMRRAGLLLGAAIFLITPHRTSAQGLETLGTRAAALGAFVAVADDASAVVWNPAGLVSGPILNIMVDVGRVATHPPDPPAPPDEAKETAITLVALGTTPVGFAYYRIEVTTAGTASPAVAGIEGRQDREVFLRTLVTSHLGATVQQSVGDHLTLGATVKLVRGHVGGANRMVSSWEEALDAAERLESNEVNRGDVDIGAMVSAGRMRAGVVVRNVTEPTFGEDEGMPLTLSRHGRVGIAWGDRWPGVARTIVALDVDVTDVPQAGGERRDVAMGIERWVRGHRVGLRGGARVSTAGDARPMVSVGATFALRPGMFADAYVAGGTSDERAWGIAARLSY
jgi:hypothetical protein